MPGPSSADANHQRVAVLDADHGALAELQRVVDEIRQAPLERARLHLHERPAPCLQRHVRADLCILRDERCRAARSRPSARIASSSSSPLNSASAPCTRPPSLEVRCETRAQPLIGDRFDAQSHSCERRAQVVRHRRQHARAAVEIAQQSILHRVECARRLADLAHALLCQRRMPDAAADGVGRHARASTAAA